MEYGGKRAWGAGILCECLSEGIPWVERGRGVAEINKNNIATHVLEGNAKC